jgi:hypothetical protein
MWMDTYYPKLDLRASCTRNFHSREVLVQLLARSWRAGHAYRRAFPCLQSIACVGLQISMQENSLIPIPMYDGRLRSTDNRSIVRDHPGEGKPDAEEKDDSLMIIPGCSSEPLETRVMQGTKRMRDCLVWKEMSAQPKLGFASTTHLCGHAFNYRIGMIEVVSPSLSRFREGLRRGSGISLCCWTVSQTLQQPRSSRT